ncbi:ABC transporter ATP-binding protein [Sabulicella rubraurantiaca]|uniref:ABC transporter ATP-binding protein n=1 Tax=Sabulicella rubraurantiaca TaxID=2811429 RepID=UPI001A96CC5C|nr:ABC transporter ATP-binding protein [Sabulicella rubraurantiaca]
MLSVKGLVAGYGDVTCLRGVSLEVGAGEVVTLIGANGAGKSTTLRAISGLLRAREGGIWFDGQSLAGMTPDRIAAQGLVHVPEGRRIFPELTVEENLRVGGHARRRATEMRDGLEAAYHRFPRLKDRHRQRAGTLSGGEQQMLAFGRAMMARPRLLMLDEPTLGLAPLMVVEVARAVRAFRAEGITILLVEQNANLALGLADRGYVMETGRIVAQGAAASLLRDPDVRASYLGAGARSEPQHVGASTLEGNPP